jgi:hypothetical protein
MGILGQNIPPFYFIFTFWANFHHLVRLQKKGLKFFTNVLFIGEKKKMAQSDNLKHSF